MPKYAAAIRWYFQKARRELLKRQITLISKVTLQPQFKTPDQTQRPTRGTHRQGGQNQPDNNAQAETQQVTALLSLRVQKEAYVL